MQIEIVKTIDATPCDIPNTFLFNLYLNDLPGFLNKQSNSDEDQLHIPKLDNVAINNLLFADDLTWSKYDLQKKISNLN